LLKEAIELGADFVDIELTEGRAAIKELQTFLRKTRGGKPNKLLVFLP